MKIFPRPDSINVAKTTSPRRRWAMFGLLVLVLVVLGSMMAGILTSMQTNNSSQSNARYSGDANNTVADGVYYGSEKGSAPAAATTAAATTAASSGGSVAQKPTSSTNSSTGYSIGNATDRMIIRNATLSVTVEDVEKSIAAVRALVAQQQGTVFSSNTTIRNEQSYATMVIQIPSGAFDETMTRLRGIAFKVDNETSSSQDVTEEYVDTDAQVRNLKATEAQLLELLKKATNVNDTLTVQRELTNVRGEIERRQGRLNFLAKKSDFSSITINIAPKGAPVAKTQTNAWDFGEVLEQAWNGSLRGLQGLATVVVNFLVYGIWILPLLALAIFLIIRTVRPIFRSSGPQSGPTPPAPQGPDNTATA